MTNDINYEFNGLPINQVGFGASCVDIVSKSIRAYPKLNASGERMVIRFTNPDLNNLEAWVRQCIHELLSTIARDLQVRPADRIGINFANVNNDKLNFAFSFRRFDQYNADLVLNGLETVIQSNSRFFLDDCLVVRVDHVVVPVGFGRRTHVGKTTAEYFKLHKSTIFNPILKSEHNTICLAVAIVIAQAYATDINQYNFLTYNRNYDALINSAEILCLNANVDLSNGGGIDEIIQFQDYLGCDYRITVFSSRDGKKKYFKSCHTNYKYTINLLLDCEHYNVVLKPTAAFATQYFCEHCSTCYTDRFGHKKCVIKCSSCLCTPLCVKEIEMKCDDCNRIFVSPRCYHNHIRNSLCSKLKLCKNCTVCYTVKKNTEHICNQSYCKVCKSIQPIRHECYMPPKKVKKETKNGTLFVFYDFECYQNTPFEQDDRKFEHEVMLCVAQQSCIKCRNSDEIEDVCENCGSREHIFIGDNVIEKFMTYLGQVNEKFREVVMISHNGQKYDMHFILKYMYSHITDWPLREESLIINGTKILRIKVGRYSFIDSINFFNVALSKLPVMFSFENHSKGYYPHYFNVPENLNYIGQLPGVEYFDAHSMKNKQYEKFIEWYNAEKEANTIFDNRKVLLEYCKEDVTILRLACLKFRAMLIELTEVDPFKYVTLASTAMAVFSTMFLKAEEISIIPRNGYRFTDNQSLKALKWLEWESHKRCIKIQSAANGREVRISHDILVDGFHHPNTVFSFLGCYWHQCIKCFPHQFHNQPSSNSKIHSLYESSRARAEKIKQLGYNLVEIWEHEFDDMMSANTEIEKYISSVEYLKVAPLDPRDAFMGGRTGVCKLYHKVGPGEKILYYDVTSLYPYINKYGSYPLGTPKILLGKDLNNRTVFDVEGLLKVDVLPPRQLYHPVLGVKLHNKLMFILCFKCAKDKNPDKCTHSDADRMFHGTYIANELRLAVQKGYRILKIYEAWHYETMTCFNKNTNSGGLFSGYIDTFVKLKTTYSGFPAWCKTQKDKKLFVKKFYEKEGILLDVNAIAKNSGYRSLAKLLLNSLWGRLGMRTNKPKKSFINSADQLLKLMVNPSYEVNHFHELSDDSLLLTYTLKAECEQIQSYVNVVLAAYTSSLARIHLYKYLDMLKERCLYHDTDSIIFTCKENESRPKLGDYLGELTDELLDFGENSYISEAVFTSEKSYAFIVKTPGKEDTADCKVKGLTLSYKNSKTVNFESMKNMVLQDQSKPLELNNRVILRTGDSRVYSAEQQYTFKVNANKRVKIGIDRTYTIPYGF